MLHSPSDPPVAKRIATQSEVWGQQRQDDFAWMREKDSEDLQQLLTDENAHVEAVLKPAAHTIETIYEEIKSRVKETDLSVPVEHGGWSYYSRSVEGLSYPIHCRKPAESKPPSDDTSESTELEQVLLDENAEAEGEDFFELGLFDISPNHELLLWGRDLVGDEKYAAEVRCLKTGECIEESLHGLAGGSAWALDSQSFFYTRQDETNRPHQVWHHYVGADPAEDKLIFEEPDQRFFVGVGRDKDDSYIYIASSSRITDEIRVIPAAKPTTPPRILVERVEGVEYSVAHHQDRFVVLTNLDAPTFRVVTMPDDASGTLEWEMLIEGDPAVTLSDIDVISDYLIMFERSEGLTRIRTRRWSDGKFSQVAQPEEVSTVWPGANVDPNADRLRYGYTSMISPASVFEVDLRSGERTLLKQQEVLGDYDPSEYRTKRVWAPAEDGVSIPMSLVWKQGRPQTGPAVIYGYGAYEASIDPAFSVARLSLLDRGFVFAIAHVRGGGEMGRQWHLDAKFEKKSVTFTDTVSCAQRLLDDGWTTPEQLVIRGGSAGGLLVGAVLNLAPELFAGAVAEVPFVDTLSTMLDESLPLTVTEWEEWGNPAGSREIFEAMQLYSPVDNVAEKPYPTIYATAGLNDTRVSYWEPAKWVQLLRGATTTANPILLWTEMEAGHVGPSGRYDSWKQEAQTLGFIVQVAQTAK